MQINLKYKIRDRDSQTTSDLIRELGFEQAIQIAYIKGISVTHNEPESILPITLLAWSHNLLLDSRKNSCAKLLLLSSFYRKLAHMLYAYQRENNMIAEVPGFIQAV